MEKESHNPEQEKWSALADELDALQKPKNEGRGVQCVRDIITYLRRGDVSNARRLAEWDHDKILDALHTKEDIRAVLKEKLFAGMEHPWKMMDEFYEKEAKTVAGKKKKGARP